MVSTFYHFKRLATHSLVNTYNIYQANENISVKMVKLYLSELRRKFQNDPICGVLFSLYWEKSDAILSSFLFYMDLTSDCLWM